MDHHVEIDPPIALRALEEKVSKLQAIVEQQDSRVKQLEKVMIEFIQLLKDQMGHNKEKMDQLEKRINRLKKHQQPCPNPAMHPSPIIHQGPCPNPTYHQSPHPGLIPSNQRAIPSPYLNPKANSGSKSNPKSSQVRKSRIFTNLGMPLSMVLGHLVKSGHLNLLDPRPPSNRLPRKYDPSLYCAYHQTPGHMTNYCTRLRHDIQDLIEQKMINPSLNPLSDILHDLQSFQSQPSLSSLKRFVASTSAQQPTSPNLINKIRKGIDDIGYESKEDCSAKERAIDMDDVPTHMLMEGVELEGANDVSEVIVFGNTAAKANVDDLGDPIN